jgi:hypothetical protein
MYRKSYLAPIPPGGKSISKPSRFGNPFKVGKDGDLAEVIRKYEAWLLAQPELVKLVKKELRGKDLYCFCKPGEPCHGDVLLRIASEGSDDDNRD